MGKLIKSQLARLMMSAALVNLLWSALWGYAYPAAFDDGVGGLSFTHQAVAPVPICQILNTVIGLLGLINEFSKPWNRFVIRHKIRFLQFIPLRSVVYILAVGPAFMQFQATQCVPYLSIGSIVYLWGYFEGERLDENGIGMLRTSTLRPQVVHA